MKYLSIGLLFFASTAFADPIRFSGSGVADSNANAVAGRFDVGGSITFDGDYANDITLPLINPTWEFDISTDGQSVTIHDMTVSYSGTIEINPLVSIDVSVEASIQGQTVDINPSTTTVWTVQQHEFESMTVSGTYYGLGLTQPFSGTLPDTTPFISSKQGLLDFVNWPDDLEWKSLSNSQGSYEFRTFSASSNNGWIGVEPYLHIREVRVYEPLSVLLTPMLPDTADFNENGGVDGSDFLIWQEHNGMASAATLSHGDANWDHAVNDADLSIWRAQYGTAVSSAAVNTVPEPCSAALLFLAGVLIVSQDKRLASAAS